LTFTEVKNDLQCSLENVERDEIEAYISREGTRTPNGKTQNHPATVPAADISRAWAFSGALMLNLS
jgi:hypothetical protein